MHIKYNFFKTHTRSDKNQKLNEWTYITDLLSLFAGAKKLQDGKIECGDKKQSDCDKEKTSPRVAEFLDFQTVVIKFSKDDSQTLIDH